MSACRHGLSPAGLSFFLVLLSGSMANAQRHNNASSGGVLVKALSVFAVDETASDADAFAQANDRTFVAGPIELHRRNHVRHLESTNRDGSLFRAKPPVDTVQAVKHKHNPSISSGPKVSLRRVPAVRQSVHQTVVGDVVNTDLERYSGVVGEITGETIGLPSPTHRVIRSPGQSQAAESTRKGSRHGIHHKAEAIRDRHRKTHPDHSSIHRRIQPEPPTIPGGREQEAWKQPYSYGYFGASGERHWSMQHGYRDRYTQWTRR